MNCIFWCHQKWRSGSLYTGDGTHAFSLLHVWFSTEVVSWFGDRCIDILTVFTTRTCAENLTMWNIVRTQHTHIRWRVVYFHMFSSHIVCLRNNLNCPMISRRPSWGASNLPRWLKIYHPAQTSAAPLSKSTYPNLAKHEYRAFITNLPFKLNLNGPLEAKVDCHLINS